MLENYFNYWSSLVKALYILLKQRIQKSEVDVAEKLLHSFFKLTETLYGEKKMTYNVHQLLHLAECTRRWGPLWANSAFVYENMNGSITRLVHGTKFLGVEIVKNISIVQGSKILKSQLMTKNLVHENNQPKKRFALGKKLQTKIINKIITEKIRNSLIHEDFDANHLSIFKRANINNQIFTSEIYDERTTDSFKVEICTSDGKHQNSLGSVICFLEKHNDLYLMLRLMSVTHTKMFYDLNTRTQVEHILPVQEIVADHYSVIKVDMIQTIAKLFCVLETYFCRRPNDIRSSVI